MTAPSPSPIPKARVRHAAGYIRVSTADQGERYSPISQKQKLLAKAANEGYTVLPEHIFEDHHTGKETARPQFERLRALVKAGGIDAVLVLCVDRFSRKVHDAAFVAAEFQRYGCTLDFVEMRNDDSPEGRFQFNIMASMAEYMGEKIVERGKDGRRRMMEANLIPGGRCPYGYDPDPAHKGKRIVNQAEAAIVIEIFRYAADGMSCYAIAALLNKRGTRNKQGNKWRNDSMLILIRNHHYIGEYEDKSGKIIPVPRIISDELFYSVQAQIGKTAKQRTGRPSNKFLLTNFLHHTCEHHKTEHRMSGKNKSYLGGIRTNRPPIQQLCPVPRLTASYVEEIVWAAIWEMLTEPAVLRSMARAWYESLPPARPDSKTAEMQRELAKLKMAYTNRNTKYDNGDEEYTPQARSEMREIKRRIAYLENEIRNIEPIMTLPPDEVIEQLCQKIRRRKPPSTYGHRRSILEGIPSLKLTYSEGELEISGQIPTGDDFPPVDSTALSGPCSQSDSPSASNDSTYDLERKCCVCLTKVNDFATNEIAYIPFILKRKVDLPQKRKFSERGERRVA